jgi:hypothetical protein
LVIYFFCCHFTMADPNNRRFSPEDLFNDHFDDTDEPMSMALMAAVRSIRNNKRKMKEEYEADGIEFDRGYINQMLVKAEDPTDAAIPHDPAAPTANPPPVAPAFRPSQPLAPAARRLKASAIADSFVYDSDNKDPPGEEVEEVDIENSENEQESGDEESVNGSDDDRDEVAPPAPAPAPVPPPQPSAESKNSTTIGIQNNMASALWRSRFKH